MAPVFYWMYTGVFDGYASIRVVTSPHLRFQPLGKKEGSIWTASILAMCLYIFINPGACSRPSSTPLYSYSAI